MNKRLHPFHQGFIDEVVPDELLLQIMEVPDKPGKMRLRCESMLDYFFLRMNSNDVTHLYGCTALMALVESTSCVYGKIQKGDIFLFPGTFSNPAPEFTGKPLINGSFHSPLTPDSSALHQQMCDLLNMPTSDFVGFSVTVGEDRSCIGWNSGTCNPHWFNERAIPDSWHADIKEALNQENIAKGLYLNLIYQYDGRKYYVGAFSANSASTLNLIPESNAGKNCLLELRCNGWYGYPDAFFYMYVDNKAVYQNKFGVLLLDGNSEPIFWALETYLDDGGKTKAKIKLAANGEIKSSVSILNPTIIMYEPDSSEATLGFSDSDSWHLECELAWKTDVDFDE